MSKSLLAILVAIQISTQIVSESVSEIDASKMSIQSRRKVMQENFEEIKLTKQKEELVKIEEENEIKEEKDLQQCENQEEINNGSRSSCLRIAHVNTAVILILV